ncbi:hypothetical protein BH20ACT18_BH20ACT18_09310 [soil metagenome]
MVGVHDDADVNEFSRYARVRGRDEQAVVAVQWIRRSPDGRLEPPRDVGPEPVLAAPGRDNDTLANAAAQRAAVRAIGVASLRKRVAHRPVVRSVAPGGG